MELESVLTFQNMYDLGKTENVLLYGDYKIPCTCKFTKNYLEIDCTAFVTEELVKDIVDTQVFKIDGVKFYRKDDLSIKNTKVGKPVICEFSLINVHPFVVENINLRDCVFGSKD